MKQIITSNKTILAAALLTLGLTGCASTQSINYTPQANVSSIAGASHVEVNVITTDSRIDKALASIKAPIGINYGDVTSNEPVDVIVGNALKQELKTRGFTVNNNNDLIVTANVTKFSGSFHSGFFAGHAIANANITVSVKKDNNVIYTKSIQGENDDAVQLAIGSNIKNSLEKALANAMTELFNDPAFIAALTTAAPAQAAAN
jgi:uncharacterized lipoprotein YajG